MTALSNVHLDLLPRGSSLFNSTRFVVQAIAVASLATILVILIPEYQDPDEQPGNGGSIGHAFRSVRNPRGTWQDNLPPGTAASLSKLPAQSVPAAKQEIVAGLQQACDQSMQGFEAASG